MSEERPQAPHGADDLAVALAAERPRLVRLCAQLAGTPGVAEDLAQETLLEAWRHQAKLHDPSGLRPWLAAIARYVYLRWRRRQGRHSTLAIAATDPTETDAAMPLWQIPPDLDADLDRRDLATLLDRALALLPAETHQALLAHYTAEISHAAIAAQLGISEGAVAVRIHRGKQALRRVLAHELRHEAEAFGLTAFNASEAGWQSTRLWCPECGVHRLQGRLDGAHGSFSVRCPQCSPEPGLEISRSIEHHALFAGMKSFKAAYTRMLTWSYRYYRDALSHVAEGEAPCWICGRPAPLLLPLPHTDPEIHPLRYGAPGVAIRCIDPSCRYGHCSSTLRALTLQLPEAQRFWRVHPRMRYLPERLIEHQGRVCLVNGFASQTSTARLDVIADRDTYQVISIYVTPGAAD